MILFRISLVVTLLSSVCFVQPKSMHYSRQGKYLVDQDGQRTQIAGHPLLVCYKDSKIVRGVFVKEVNGTIYLKTGNLYWKTDKPVCVCV
jgi:hypothetical protein